MNFKKMLNSEIDRSGVPKMFSIKQFGKGFFEPFKLVSEDENVFIFDNGELKLQSQFKEYENGVVIRKDTVTNISEEKVILNLDGQKTYRILENLLSNTLKYAMPGSRVYIDVLNEEMQVQIVYKNISATELSMDLEHLTERFVRGDASRNSEGSGLGLAIVKSFTEIQGGEFKIEVDGDLFKALLIWKK